MNPGPRRFHMSTPSNIILAQAAKIKEQQKEIDKLKEAIKTINRHADGIAAARKELIWLLNGKSY